MVIKVPAQLTAFCRAVLVTFAGSIIPNYSLIDNYDLSIIGFDDAVFAHHVYPRLTTVKNPIYQMGEMSARHILNAVYGQSLAVKTLFDPKLIMRESTIFHKA